MKTVLIISFAYPPLNAIGAKRISKISKEILDLGWKPIIITSQNPRSKFESEIEIPKYLVHHVEWPDPWVLINKLECNRVGKFISKVLKKLIPFTTAGIPELRRYYWINPALKKAKEIIANEKIDIIYSSFTPPASSRVAAKLSLYTGIPWVNEYRDLWSGNPYIRRTRLSSIVNKLLERKIMHNCAALITVSDPLRDHLIKEHNKPTYTIYNGYDQLDTEISTQSNENFRIVYTGSLYKGLRDPEILFAAISKMNSDLKQKLRVEFYGPNVDKVLAPLIKNYNLKEIVHYTGEISYEQAILKQKEANLLLLLGRNHVSDSGILTGKLFEYMERKKPILALTYPHGAMKQIFDKTGIGEIFTRENELRAFLEKNIMHHLNDEKEVLVNADQLSFFSRRNQVQKLLRIFENVIQ